ncbi:melanocortin 1 receptor, partial, partial [Paramuricea clavata]
MDMYSNFNVSLHNDTPIERETGFEFITTPAVIAIVVSIIDGVLILFGATINLAVIVAIVRHHRELKTMDLFILNLCLSDFVSSIFYQPLVITRLLARSAQSHIHTGVFRMATFSCLLVDCAALFLVTFDKYLGIRFPFRYHMYFRKQYVVAIITCGWVIATAIGLTFALLDQAAKIAGIIYGLLLLIMFILTPVLQIASFFIAKRHERRIQRMEKVVANCDCTREPKPADEIPSIDNINAGTAHSSINNSKPVHPFTSKAARTITILTT